MDKGYRFFPADWGSGLASRALQ